jgi:hypothetical protein
MVFLAAFLNNVRAPFLAVALFASIFLFHLIGMWIGKFQKKINPEAKSEGLGPLEGALLGLLALMLSFTFSMSASRHDARRNVIVKEANNIETAIMRANLYPDTIRKELRKYFQKYVDARIAYYASSHDEEKVQQSLKDAATISHQLWETTSRYCKENIQNTLPHALMIPALNEMIDVVASRDAARVARVPNLILWLLFILSMLGSSIIGYSKKERKIDWIALTIYSTMTVATIYTIIDLDRSRRGFITTDSENHKIVELKKLFTDNI